jgi:hypothetical protein
MSGSWGLETEERSASEKEALAKRALPPEARSAGHKGIIWIHTAAIGIWLFTAALLGALWLAGKNVPGAIVIAGLLAALGHGLAVAVHAYLGRAASRAAAAPHQK